MAEIEAGMVEMVGPNGERYWAHPGPTLVGMIRATSIDGYSHLEMRPADGYVKPVFLCAWSDGTVTWTDRRDG